MIYYYSAPSSSKKQLLDCNVNTYLLSFANDSREIPHYIHYKDLLIDSGAFSVWNSGRTIDIDNYLKFISSLPPQWSCINLDVIVDKSMSKKKIADSIEQSYQNFLYLSSKRPNILPVHHYGEDMSVMKRYLNHTDHMCISPTKGLRTSEVDKYLEECFSLIDPKKVKLHALGMTIQRLMLKYPFYSVDSITYKKARLGRKNTNYWGVGAFNCLAYEQIRYWQHVTAQITNVWKERGIQWD